MPACSPRGPASTGRFGREGAAVASAFSAWEESLAIQRGGITKRLPAQAKSHMSKLSAGAAALPAPASPLHVPGRVTCSQPPPGLPCRSWTLRIRCRMPRGGRAVGGSGHGRHGHWGCHERGCSMLPLVLLFSFLCSLLAWHFERGDCQAPSQRSAHRAAQGQGSSRAARAAPTLSLLRATEQRTWVMGRLRSWPWAAPGPRSPVRSWARLSPTLPCAFL